MTNQNDITEIYHSEEGEKIAADELLPIIKMYNKSPAPKILEIGTSFGRNLWALSQVPGAQVSGCDLEPAGLQRSLERVKKNNLTNVHLVAQTEEDRVPYPDAAFDIVVLWQVMEHIPNPAIKKAIIAEACRVVRSGGIVILETPNQLFPIDHHDTDLPFVHWIFTPRQREKLIQKTRHASWPASIYMTIGFLNRTLKKIPRKVHQESVVYFQKSYGDIFKHWGGTRQWAKKIFFVLYYPLYLVIRLFGGPGDLLCPSLRIVLRVQD